MFHLSTYRSLFKYFFYHKIVRENSRINDRTIFRSFFWFYRFFFKLWCKVKSFLSTFQIISAVALWVNGTILSYLYEIESIVKSVNLINIDDYVAMEREDPEADHQTLTLIYRFLVVYYIIWISFKFVYVTTVVFTAFAIYKVLYF